MKRSSRRGRSTLVEEAVVRRQHHRQEHEDEVDEHGRPDEEDDLAPLAARARFAALRGCGAGAGPAETAGPADSMTGHGYSVAAAAFISSRSARACPLTEHQVHDGVVHRLADDRAVLRVEPGCTTSEASTGLRRSADKVRCPRATARWAPSGCPPARREALLHVFAHDVLEQFERLGGASTEQPHASPQPSAAVGSPARVGDAGNGNQPRNGRVLGGSAGELRQLRRGARCP